MPGILDSHTRVLIYINAKTTGMRFDHEQHFADVTRRKGRDSAMTTEDFARAETLTALRAQCRGRVRRQNVGFCAVVIVAVSLLGWAVIVWPLVGHFR